jgi:hypothetical protein
METKSLGAPPASDAALNEHEKFLFSKKEKYKISIFSIYESKYLDPEEIILIMLNRASYAVGKRKHENLFSNE